MSYRPGYFMNDLPKCPFCGMSFPVWDEDNPLTLDYQDGGRTVFQCEYCAKSFVCVTNISYNFSTAVSEEMADDEEWGPQEDAPEV